MSKEYFILGKFIEQKNIMYKIGINHNRGC